MRAFLTQSVVFRAAAPLSGDLVGGPVDDRHRHRRCVFAVQPARAAEFPGLRHLPEAEPRPAAESAVLVVDIDDESIRQLGQWPWSRTVLASIIDRLTEQGAAAIGLDIILSEPDRTSPALAVAQLEGQGFQITFPGSEAELDHDRILAASFGRSPVVAGLVLAELGDYAAAAPESRLRLRRRQSCCLSAVLSGKRAQPRHPGRSRARHRRVQLPGGARRRGAPDPASVASWREPLSVAVDRGAAHRAGRFKLHREKHGRQPANSTPAGRA